LYSIVWKKLYKEGVGVENVLGGDGGQGGQEQQQQSTEGGGLRRSFQPTQSGRLGVSYHNISSS